MSFFYLTVPNHIVVMLVDLKSLIRSSIVFNSIASAETYTQHQHPYQHFFSYYSDQVQVCSAREQEGER